VELNGRHVISIDDFDSAAILDLFALATDLTARPRPDLLDGRVMATLFFEPSTRTRLSFEAAMCKLGGEVIGFADAGSTSIRKGESLADTIRMVEQYADLIVMRHPRDGSARLASEVSAIPVINGGDGSNQHPSQTLLDLYTIDQLFPDRLAGSGEALRVAFAGDLRYGRTVHSLLRALCRFNVAVRTVAVPGRELPDAHLAATRAAGISIEPCADLAEAAATVDVLYMTRLQEERFPDPIEYDHVKASYRLDRATLADARPELRILHPLPRVGEIPREIDATPHAHYFAQAGNGMPVRQALLATVLGERP